MLNVRTCLNAINLSIYTECTDVPLARIYGNCFKMLIINVLAAKHLIRAKGTSVQAYTHILIFKIATGCLKLMALSKARPYSSLNALR